MITGAKDINNNPIPTFESLSKLLKPTDEERGLKKGKVTLYQSGEKPETLKPELTKADKDRLESCILNMIETVEKLRNKYGSKTLFYIAAQKEIDELRELLNKVWE